MPKKSKKKKEVENTSLALDVLNKLQQIQSDYQKKLEVIDAKEESIQKEALARNKAYEKSKNWIEGGDIASNEILAKQFLQRACPQPNAEYMLGKLGLCNIWKESDFKTNIQLIESAAAKGHLRAQFDTALLEIMSFEDFLKLDYFCELHSGKFLKSLFNANELENNDNELKQLSVFVESKKSTDEKLDHAINFFIFVRQDFCDQAVFAEAAKRNIAGAQLIHALQQFRHVNELDALKSIFSAAEKKNQIAEYIMGILISKANELKQNPFSYILKASSKTSIHVNIINKFLCNKAVRDQLEKYVNPKGLQLAADLLREPARRGHMLAKAELTSLLQQNIYPSHFKSIESLPAINLFEELKKNKSVLDIKECIDFVTPAANNGNVEAIFLKAYLLLEGKNAITNLESIFSKKPKGEFLYRVLRLYLDKGALPQKIEMINLDSALNLFGNLASEFKEINSMFSTLIFVGAEFEIPSMQFLLALQLLTSEPTKSFSLICRSAEKNYIYSKFILSKLIFLISNKIFSDFDQSVNWQFNFMVTTLLANEEVIADIRKNFLSDQAVINAKSFLKNNNFNQCLDVPQITESKPEIAKTHPESTIDIVFQKIASDSINNDLPSAYALIKNSIETGCVRSQFIMASMIIDMLFGITPINGQSSPEKKAAHTLLNDKQIYKNLLENFSNRKEAESYAGHLLTWCFINGYEAAQQELQVLNIRSEQAKEIVYLKPSAHSNIQTKSSIKREKYKMKKKWQNSGALFTNTNFSPNQYDRGDKKSENTLR